MFGPPRRLFVVLAVLVLAGAGAALAAGIIPGRLAHHQTVFGRVLRPDARLVRLGHFPTGGAVTADGRFYWTVSTGRARNDVRIVSLTQSRPRVVQTLGLPGASGGIALDSRRRLAYVSGLQDSSDADEKRPDLPGRAGDVVHVFTWNARGRARELRTIAVPPPASAPVPQSFPPKTSGKTSYPDRLALSPDGSRLLVPLNLADAAAIVDVDSGAVRTVATGHFPYGAAILPDGKTGLVSNETDGTVSVVDLDAAQVVKQLQVSSHLSHPEAIALDLRGARAFVAVANTDQVGVIDTRTLTVQPPLSVERPEGRGVSPVALEVTPDGRRLLVAEAGGDEIAAFALQVPGRKPFALLGRIPTAAYPADVHVLPRRGRTPGRLVWIAGKGFGSGPNRNGPNPYATSDDSLLRHPGSAVLSDGFAGVQAFPSDGRIRALTRTADRDVHPTNVRVAPPGTPLRPGGPIKHVFYVVRENRTYDQVLGDDPRGDGDSALSIFGRRVTPNIHALARRFGLLDHVYANSEASIDGHFWTSAGAVSDYVHKAWQQNYAKRGRPYDFGVYTATFPGTGFLFDQAERQGISYFNYGEAIAGVIGLVPDKDRSLSDTTLINQKFLKSDLGIGAPVNCYPNDASIGKDVITGVDVYDSTAPKDAKLLSESRFDCFRSKLQLQLLTNSVPAFNYMVLSNDHTEGTTPGRRTPRAMVAENDLALGQIVGLISHSKIWRSSAIFVIEDDSQDGADHVDAHRMPAAVISPYTKPSAVVHDRYDMLSVIRSMELILGMRPLGFFDANAAPMYSAFDSAPGNAEPYETIGPTYPINEKNAATAANARLSKSLRINTPDRVPQRELDRILWQSVHGRHSLPPPPGPNAQGDPDG